MTRTAVRLVTALTALASLALVLPGQPARKPRKVAFLIGINTYDKPGLDPLRHAERDVTVLGEELRTRCEFDEVIVLRGSAADDSPDRATKANVFGRLKPLVAKCRADDLIVVSLCGHGVQSDFQGKVKEDAFFVPVDGVANDPATLVRVSELIDDVVGPNVGRKLFLIDACRNDTDANRGLRGIEGNGAMKLPDRTAVLFACSRGQRAQEREALDGGHGLLTFAVLDGIRGKAADRQGRISWSGLVSHVEQVMVDEDLRKRIPGFTVQTPVEARNQVPFTILGTVTIAKGTPPVPDKVEPKEGEALVLDLGGGETMTLMPIPAGTFQMGSPDSDTEAKNKEKPQHSVKITHGFFLGRTEVTVGQFKRFVADATYRTEAENNSDNFGVNGETGLYETNATYTWKKHGYPQTDDHPVVFVSPNDARAFCDWLSRKTGKQVRLPREAEWEYACRAGTTTSHYNGNDPEALAKIANVADGTAKKRFDIWTNTIAAEDGYVFTAPVGRFDANRWGLRDMIGNVWEWCDDGMRTFTTEPQTDPVGSGTDSVFRGGSFYYGPRDCQSASREKSTPTDRRSGIGFRVLVVR